MTSDFPADDGPARAGRRYARLVRLYPSRYPRDEILDTVLQGGGTFSYREAFSLLGGALRARTGADVHRTPAEFARSATRLAALALLVHAAAVDVLTALPLDLPAVVRAPDGIVQYATAGLVALILHVIALTAVTRGAYRTAAATAVLGMLASAAGRMPFGFPWHHDGFWAAPLAALLITALALAAARLSARERSSPLWWLLAIIPAIVLLPTGSRSVLPIALHIDQQALLVLTVLAVGLSLLDPRIPLAIAALALSKLLTWITVTLLEGYLPAGEVAISVAITTAPILVLVGSAGFSRRRSPI